MTMGRPWGLLSWKKYREWAWGPRSNWWMPARNWSSPNSCSVGQDSSVIGDKAQVLKVSYLKSTLSRLYLLHKKTSSFSSTRVFFLEQARPFDTADPPQTPAINALRPAMAAGSGPGGSWAVPGGSIIFPSKWPSISAILHILLL